MTCLKICLRVKLSLVLYSTRLLVPRHSYSFDHWPNKLAYLVALEFSIVFFTRSTNSWYVLRTMLSFSACWISVSVNKPKTFFGGIKNKKPSRNFKRKCYNFVVGFENLLETLTGAVIRQYPFSTWISVIFKGLWKLISNNPDHFVCCYALCVVIAKYNDLRLAFTEIFALPLVIEPNSSPSFRSPSTMPWKL